jgi:hypothetical protein
MGTVTEEGDMATVGDTATTGGELGFLLAQFSSAGAGMSCCGKPQGVDLQELRECMSRKKTSFVGFTPSLRHRPAPHPLSSVKKEKLTRSPSCLSPSVKRNSPHSS